MADPGFPVEGAPTSWGRQLPRRLHFVKFVCQNQRIWTLGGRAPAAPPGSANAHYVNAAFNHFHLNYLPCLIKMTQITEVQRNGWITNFVYCYDLLTEGNQKISLAAKGLSKIFQKMRIFMHFDLICSKNACIFVKIKISTKMI